MTKYLELTADGLLKMSLDMVEYARRNPFDTRKAVESAKSDDNLAKEMVGGMMCVCGPKSSDYVRPYNRFFRARGLLIQVTYYEMPVEDYKVGQLTVVENCERPLDADLVDGLADLFF